MRSPSAGLDYDAPPALSRVPRHWRVTRSSNLSKTRRVPTLGFGGWVLGLNELAPGWFNQHFAAERGEHRKPQDPPFHTKDGAPSSSLYFLNNSASVSSLRPPCQNLLRS